MKRKILAIAVACFCLSIQEVTAQSAFQSEKLQKVWETPEGLNTPESACYDRDSKIIYVSNIVGNPQEKEVLGSKGDLIAINKKTKAIRKVAEKTGYLDGIVVVGKNEIMTSDWKGNVQLIVPGKPIEKILDTTPIKVNAADLGFIPSQNILLVPTFTNNKVIVYKLSL